MYINVTEKQFKCSNDLTYSQGVALLLSGIMHITEETIQQKPESVGNIYDYLNAAFGIILDKIQPDVSPATDLTAQAILEAENRILEREVPDAEESNEEDS